MMLFLSAVSLMTALPVNTLANARADRVATTAGLVAFWDFQSMQNGAWQSRCDSTVITNSFPVYLHRVGDTTNYSLQNWPYNGDSSRIVYDSSGPFGQAIRFNRGYIYGSIPRSTFDKTLLDIRGYMPFTMVAWVKYKNIAIVEAGQRHMACGIWDEGGWNKYAGRRQVALFAGLFNSSGVTAHVSSNGAASYPQSNVNGSQYARERALDGSSFSDNAWVMMAMSYDPGSKLVIASQNGIATPKLLTDPIVQDVFRPVTAVPANPFVYDWPIFSSRAFVVKYNGYSDSVDHVFEHWIYTDLDSQFVTYRRSVRNPSLKLNAFRIRFTITSKTGAGVLTSPIVTDSNDIGVPISFSVTRAPQAEDTVVTSLEEFYSGTWHPVGTVVKRDVVEGAPFTFGRALGLGTTDMNAGSLLYMGGAAVFNRVLTDNELTSLSSGVPTVIRRTSGYYGATRKSRDGESARYDLKGRSLKQPSTAFVPKVSAGKGVKIRVIFPHE